MKPCRFISLYILFCAIWVFVMTHVIFPIHGSARENAITLLMVSMFWLAYTVLWALAGIIYRWINNRSSRGFLWVPLVMLVVFAVVLGKNELIALSGFTTAFVIAWLCSRKTTPSSPPQ